MLGWLGLTALSLPTAAPGEARAFAAARAAFDLGLWERAEREFAGFVERFPNSDRRAEAILFQARARFRQNKFTGVVELLTAHQEQARRLADEYQFWIAEAQLQASNHLAAADAYANLLWRHPQSPRVLDAAVGEAWAYARLGQWARVVELLSPLEGAFQQAAASPSTNAIVADGWLLLAEAQYRQTNYAAARAVLESLAGRALSPERSWRRQVLLCQTLLAAGELPAALTAGSNLVALATAWGPKKPLAESIAFQAELLERADRFEEAVALYEQNLAEGVPGEFQQQARERIATLAVTRLPPDSTIARLEKLVSASPDAPGTDALLLAAAELYFRAYLVAAAARQTNGVPSPEAAANALPRALNHLDRLTTNFPHSAQLGRAHLLQGWARLELGEVTNARPALERAVAELPAGSDDLATARFKLADALSQLGDWPGALTNYLALVRDPEPSAATRERLLEPAWYQVVRGSLAVDDLAGATNALTHTLREFPGRPSCAQAALLVGQELMRRGDPAGARALLLEVLAAAPESSLCADLELAVARTHEQEDHWREALQRYEQWLTRFPNHPERPRAEFYRAWAVSRDGEEARARERFAAFLTAFPNHELAPLAQNWIADHYFRQGNYKSAEEHYQLLYQKWPASALALPALMMAGRAAVARQGLTDAIGYFTNLINNLQCPPDLLAEALFAYGDTLMSLPPAETNRPLANFEEAARIFSKLHQMFATNRIADLALGRLGDCYFQLGAQDPKLYEDAIRVYSQVIESPRADVAVRSQAEYGLALALERQAALQATADERARWLKRALDHHVNILLGTNLRETETADPVWLKRAGLAAGRLAEELQDWELARRIYQQLRERLPVLAGVLDRRLARIEEQLRGGPGR